MSEQDWLAQRFEEHRRRLRAVAYRMLGSLSEADDAVPFEQIAPLIDRSPQAARQLAYTVVSVLVRNGKIAEMDFLVDPERLAGLDLTMLGDLG